MSSSSTIRPFIFGAPLKVQEIVPMSVVTSKWCFPSISPRPPTDPSPAAWPPQDIVIPDTYPFRPPEMKFITKVYHPNVSSVSGAISLDILQDAWSPAFTLHTMLISLQSFLCSPEPNDPLDAEVARQYLTLPKCFEDTARNWTRIYARRPTQGSGASIRDEGASACPCSTSV